MDQTKRPLLIPPELATYAEEHDLFDTYRRMLETIIMEKPDDPIAVMIDLLKRDNDDVPQIVVLGPPSSGKHTISKALCNLLRTSCITEESLLKDAESTIQGKVEEFVQQNKPVPTEIWVEIIISRLREYDCTKKGWVLCGMPKTREQAIAMQAAGITAKHFVLLSAPDTVLLERASGKRIDPKTEEIYHTAFDMPSDSTIASRLTTPKNYTEAELVNRLVDYHRHIRGICTAYSNVRKDFNADQPKSDVVAQVTTFVNKRCRSVAPHTPRIVLIGPIGSGKKVQAALLAKKYNIINVNCGELINEAIAGETRNGLACKPYVAKKMPVPDTIILNVLKDRLAQLDCVSRGWVLHGYPRTREQAEQLTFAGFVPNRVFFLDVPNDSVLERLSQRATDPITGEKYHMLYNPPRSQEVKQRLAVRPCDEPEAIQQKLSMFAAYADELQDFYQNSQHINGDQDPHTVFESIESRIVNPIPKGLK